ncbi:hypothetical protein, partial [Pseudorhodobacter sp.]|uniref:hypothetical protein n=1 Tax=Pseudorhodobacter sp. TaxID=1934400 RepID=UPI002649DB49
AAITYSAADLKAVADAYDFDTAPAPIVVGHPDADAPAFGWVESFEYDAAAGRLFANLNEIEPAFAELVKAGRFKKVSMSFFRPDQGHNPVPGTWYPKHVGFLGAAAPAVSGLANAKFAGDAGAVFTRSFGSGQEAASLFRALRDFMIDQFGIENANTALPPWKIDWLEEIDDIENADRPGAGFAASTNPNPKEEPAVNKQPDPAFAAREADVTAREARIAARETEITHADNVNFAESLVEGGRLIPASKDKIVAILDALPSEATVSFAEGAAKLAPAAALREVLNAQPKVVSFGEMDLGEDGPEGGKAVDFAADGKAVDANGLAVHRKAIAYQNKFPGTAYLAAVAAVS